MEYAQRPEKTKDALVRTIKAFEAAGLPDARADAEFLLTHILGVRRHELYTYPERPLTGAQAGKLEEYIDRRVRREPCQYIIGKAEFMGLAFDVTRATLIPRPETELLVEEAARALKGKKNAVIADLCTGSGCVAVSIAKEVPGGKVYATDISADAIDVARENARRHGVLERVVFLEGDLLSPLTGLGVKADMVVSNPPYVSAAEFEGLAPDVKDWEPKEALYGGEEGLDFIKRIIDEAPDYLKEDGLLIFEFGYGQADSIRDIVEGDGRYSDPWVINDLARIERIFKLRLKGYARL